MPRNTPRAVRSGGIARRRVVIPARGVRLGGDLAVPPDPKGLVVFVHGASCDRRCARHRRVARSLERAGFATLRVDLRTAAEGAAEHAAMARAVEVGPMAERLAVATDWARAWPALGSLRVGYFGEGDGAAVALAAAAARPKAVRAVVSDAGRLDLAAAVLPNVQAATLLIEESEDATVRARLAVDRLRGECALVLAEGASHLLRNPAATARINALTVGWFERHLPTRGNRTSPWGPGGPARCEEFRPAGRRPDAAS